MWISLLLLFYTLSISLLPLFFTIIIILNFTIIFKKTRKKTSTHMSHSSVGTCVCVRVCMCV